MKNVSQIITSLQNKPQFSKLKKFKCIDKIQSMFLPSFTRFVKFAYFQNNTLFFVLNHNAGKQEFNKSIESIKSVLKLYTPEECDESSITDIKAFVSHSPRKKEEDIKIMKRYYKERASGEVKADVHDPKLKNLLQSIQDIIKEKNESRD